jgi:hypothetical protein
MRGAFALGTAAVLAAVCSVAGVAVAAQPEPPPRSPAESLAVMYARPGFVVEVLSSGFKEGNPQLRINGLRYGLDNWIYCANG